MIAAETMHGEQAFDVPDQGRPEACRREKCVYSGSLDANGASRMTHRSGQGTATVLTIGRNALADSSTDIWSTIVYPWLESLHVEQPPRLDQMRCARCGGGLGRVYLTVGSVVSMRCHHSIRLPPDGKRETCGWENTVRATR